MMTAPLHDRTAVVTGLSRRIGIGHAIVERLLADGALVYATGWSAHDAEMPWGLDPFDESDFDEERFAYNEADMADPEVPARLLDDASDRFGPVDIVVATHARSSRGGLAEVTVEELDRCWQVNARVRSFWPKLSNKLMTVSEGVVAWSSSPAGSTSARWTTRSPTPSARVPYTR